MMNEKREFEDLTVIEIAEEISTAQYRMSECYGIERVVKDLREKSGQAYAAKQDKKAETYREIADNYEIETKKHRTTTHAEWSERRRRLFEELELRFPDED